MNANEIDWTKAPEGATHWGPDTEDWFESWYMKTDKGYKYHSKSHNDWDIEGSMDSIRESELVERPKEVIFNDITFFVGNELEYSLNNGATWFKCNIKYVVEDSGVVAECYNIDPTIEQWLCFNKTVFREIDKEAGEREKAIQEMWMKVHTWYEKDITVQKKVCEELYDAGYRLINKGESK